MPQAPLPAPASRIGTVPPLISPIVQQIGQPFNVMPYMNYPNMLDAATKGLKLGQMIASLPQEGRENAFQYMMAGAAKEHAAQLQQAIKEIKATPNASSQWKSQQISQLLARTGVTFGEQAASINAPSGLQAGINAINATAQNPGLNYGFNPPPGQPMNAPVAPGQPPQGQQDTELQNLRTGGSDYD